MCQFYRKIRPVFHYHKFYYNRSMIPRLSKYIHSLKEIRIKTNRLPFFIASIPNFSNKPTPIKFQCVYYLQRGLNSHSSSASIYEMCQKRGGCTDKRTDVWSRDFMIWKINSGLWAVVWAGL